MQWPDCVAAQNRFSCGLRLALRAFRIYMKPYPYAAGEEYPSDAAHLGYQLDYNTRSRSGRLPDDLRYNYDH